MVRIPSVSVAVILAFLYEPHALAEINGFQFNGITPLGNCELNQRIGKTAADTKHVINVEDCNQYTGCTIEVMWSLTRTPAVGTKYAVKMSEPGGSCNTNNLTDLGSSCYQELLVGETTLDSPVNNTFTVPLDPLMGGDCAAKTDKTTTVYVVMDEAGVVSHQTIEFRVDLKPPEPVELGEPKEGDENVVVNWTDEANQGESEIRYRVYWADFQFDNSTKDTAEHSGLVSAHSYQVTGLTNDKPYYFGVAAVDENENESALSEVVPAMPIASEDAFEHYKAAGGREEGGYCFIATAAFGSPMEQHVMLLRRFRDRYLMANSLGRRFVHAYYRYSPPLARWIARHDVARAVTRTLLWPLVAWSYVALRLGLLLGALLALLSCTWPLAVARLVRSRRGGS